jgi:tetratricopeptide (TPR) repeat protein
VNKQQLIKLLQKPSSISLRELEALEEAVEIYPYFQLAHTLIARAHQEHETVFTEEKLHTAAIYALDRDLLKQIMETNFLFESNFLPGSEPSDKTLEEAPADHSPDQQEHFFSEEADSAQPTDDEPTTQELGENQGIYQEIEQTMRELRSTREKLGLTEPSNPQPTSLEQEEPLQFQTSENTAEDQSEEPKNLETLEYIEEIAKREEKTISEVQKKQQEIIDNFIANAPKIQRLKFQPEPEGFQEDLSKRYAQLNNELLTENLAAIMAKQGKTQKAIDIYQKLIWKNPEKKAYFVSCIENLKNQ